LYNSDRVGSPRFFARHRLNAITNSNPKPNPTPNPNPNADSNPTCVKAFTRCGGRPTQLY